MPPTQGQPARGPLATRVRWWTEHHLPWGRRVRERQDAQFILLLRQASALLQVGRHPFRLWAELGELHQPCDRPAHRRPPGCCLGHVLEQARARQLLEEPPLHGLRRQWAQLGAILQISAAAGVPLAALLDRLADAWEDGQDGHQARQAAAAGPRSTARLLALLPVAGIGLSVAAGAPPTQMLSTPAGWLVLGCGAVLAVVGTVWTRALVRRAEAE